MSNETTVQQQALDDKLLAMKNLAYGASHEINNPLANIASRAQLLAKSETDPEKKRQLATIYQQAIRAHDMISDMMLFAHPTVPQIEPFLLAEALTLAQQKVAPNDVANWELPTDQLRVLGCRGQIASVMTSLFANAIEAGATSIVVSHTSSKGVATITVSDNGCGMSSTARQHLFDPFFSGREAGRGIGFGLSKAWQVLKLHGGSIRMSKSSESGTSMEIMIPIPQQ